MGLFDFFQVDLCYMNMNIILLILHVRSTSSALVTLY